MIKKLYHFLKNVVTDERIPQKDKKILAAMVALIFSPIDLIPDWIPFFGLLDDALILGIILDYFFSVLDSRILLSHFPWEMKHFTRLKRVAGIFSALVPSFIKRRIWTYVQAPY